MTESNNENVNLGAGFAAPEEVEYQYSEQGNNGENMTEEERLALEREVEENNRRFEERRLAREQANRERQLQERRATRILRPLPGRASWISRAKGSLNTRRRAAARNAAIRNRSRAARQQFKRNVNNTANIFEMSALQNIGEMSPEMQLSALEDLPVRIESFKGEAVDQIRRTLRNTALEANARLYGNTKRVLESYTGSNAKYRPMVLKIGALDDMMVIEKEKLALANTNEKAREAATKLYNIEVLKEELNRARHESKLPTPEQNARYNALVQGFNFNSMPTSFYRRLRNVNANLTRKNKAATKIQALARGAKGRKTVRAMKAARNAAPAPNFMVPPMIPVNVPAQPQGQVLGGPGAVAAPPLSRAELAALRAARFARGGRRTRRH